MNDDDYKVIKLISDRIDDLAESYRVLNESHINLELQFVELRTQLQTMVSLIKWLVTPSMVFSAIVFIVKLLELAKVL